MAFASLLVLFCFFFLIKVAIEIAGVFNFAATIHGQCMHREGVGPIFYRMKGGQIKNKWPLDRTDTDAGIE